MQRKRDAEKARRRQNMIREATRSGLSVREFCVLSVELRDSN
jgi:hypothetical protein